MASSPAVQAGAVEERRRDPWLVRAVPALVLAGGLVVMLVAILVSTWAGVSQQETTELSVGRIDVRVAYAVPSPAMIGAGVLAALGLALLVAGVDAWAGRRSSQPERASTGPPRRPLGAGAARPVPAGPLAVTVLVPACNEERNLPASLASLHGQTVPPAAVWVVADNCTDGTVAVARAHGAEVYETVDNHHRKAGGLNQLLARLLPTMGPRDVVLVMDADTIIVDDFLEVALAELRAEPDLDAVGGVFYGDSAPGLLAQLQRNEYLRYSRDISRRQGRVFVLTGTATVFRAETLATVAEHRGTTIPGTPGAVYDTFSLTEDNELTMAVKTLGARLLSPKGCRVRTELMPTWRDLWRQRERWQRGALENIGTYGLTSASARYWLQQLGLGYGLLALVSWVTLGVVSYVAFGVFTVVLFWVVLGLLFAVERTATVWRGGWKARLLALPLVVELAYAVVLQAVYAKSLLDIATGTSKSWNAAVVARPVS